MPERSTNRGRCVKVPFLTQEAKIVRIQFKHDDSRPLGLNGATTQRMSVTLYCQYLVVILWKWALSGDQAFISIC